MIYSRLIVLSAILLLTSLTRGWSAAPHEHAATAAGDSLTSSPLDSLQLKSADLPEGQRFAKMSYVRSIQAATLYSDPGMYSFILGNLEEKRAQSIDGSDEKNGTILYFRFDRPLKKSKPFIDGLIWGEAAGPTEEHPEEILINGNVMVILSFAKGSAVGEQMKNLMMKRMGL